MCIALDLIPAIWEGKGMEEKGMGKGEREDKGKEKGRVEQTGQGGERKG